MPSVLATASHASAGRMPSACVAASAVSVLPWLSITHRTTSNTSDSVSMIVPCSNDTMQTLLKSAKMLAAAANRRQRWQQAAQAAEDLHLHLDRRSRL